MDKIITNESDTNESRRKFLRKTMMEQGLKSMSLVEVVELMLYYTIHKGDVRPIAHELVARFGTIDRMSKASSAERMSVPGMDELTDEHFAMIGMFIPYVFRNRMGEYPMLDTWYKLAEFCVSLHIKHEYQVLYILCLNSVDRLIKKECKVSIGTPLSLQYEMKHILDAVANTQTVKVVLCHNHLGYDPDPSKEDVEFTKHVQEYLRLIGISLHDHVIVTDNEAASMRSLGFIQ